MNKGELVETLAASCDMNKSTADQVVNSILSAISEALSADDKVTLIGFGTFSVSERAARQGRNPQTGETIQIAAKKSVKFKPGKQLEEFIQ